MVEANPDYDWDNDDDDWGAGNDDDAMDDWDNWEDDQVDVDVDFEQPELTN